MQERGAIPSPNIERISRFPTKLNAPGRPLRIAVVSSPPKTTPSSSKSAPLPEQSPYLRSTKAVFGQPLQRSKTDLQSNTDRPVGRIPLRRPLTPLSDTSRLIQTSQEKTLAVGNSGKENGITFFSPPDDTSERSRS